MPLFSSPLPSLIYTSTRPLVNKPTDYFLPRSGALQMPYGLLMDKAIEMLCK